MAHIILYYVSYMVWVYSVSCRTGVGVYYGILAYHEISFKGIQIYGVDLKLAA